MKFYYCQMKRVVLTVTNDLNSDRRVQRSIAALRSLGYETTFVGRELNDSEALNFDFPSRRFKLWFNKGFFFYAVYNLRLFFFLLFSKPFDVYWANDLDSLLPNYLVSRLYRKKLVYDSHEYFTGVPEIQGRPLVKGIWKALESFIYPKLKHILTVNESIANLLEQDYGQRPKVVRNIAESFLPSEVKSREELGLRNEAFLMINQGAGINVDRGMEEVFQALDLLDPQVELLLVGKGDVIPKLKEMAKAKKMEERIHFIAPLPYAEMLHYTLNADLGLSLDKDTNLNYRFSLPNKLFDYIKCGIPILSSKVVEVRKIVEGEKIGLSLAVEPQAIAKAVEEIRLKPNVFEGNLKAAAQKHNWEKEEKRLIDFIKSI